MRLSRIVLSFVVAISAIFETAQGKINREGVYPTVDWRTDADAFESHFLIPQNINFTPFMNFPNVPIDPNFLKTKLEEYSGAIPVEIQGKKVTIAERGTSEGRTLARAYLAQEYSRLGYNVSLQQYKEGANFVAEKLGEDPSKVLILSAHLDSVKNAGADDDGAGTISVLAIAAALSKAPLKYNLRVVGFDQEELGLVGSKAYVEALEQKGELSKVMGDINLEMTAYDAHNDGNFHVMDCDRSDSTPLSAAILGAVEALHIPLKRSKACTNRSDHARFWSKNKPAVVVSEDFFGGHGNPCYHKSCDTVDKLNLVYMTNMTRAVASATASLIVTAGVRSRINRLN